MYRVNQSHDMGVGYFGAQLSNFFRSFGDLSRLRENDSQNAIP